LRSAGNPAGLWKLFLIGYSVGANPQVEIGVDILPVI